MGYNVTSWFIDELLANNYTPIRRFLINNDDYSDRVIRWPRIKNSWNSIRAQSITLDLANEDNLFSFIHNDKTNLSLTCKIKFGLTHPTSGDELLTLFSGTMDKVNYSKGLCKITLLDKFKQLSERVVGDSDLPMSLSNVLPSDIAWAAVTSYGGMSNIEDTYNPDIDWESFQAWAAVFSGDNVLMGCNIADKKVSEVLKILSNQTNSAIYVENNKVNFKRFNLADSSTNEFNNDTIINVSLNIDDEDIVNRQHVYGLYNVSSDSWAMKVYEESTGSISNYGLREQIEKSDSIWYVNSSSALNLAQRVINTAGDPYDRIELNSPIAVGLVQIGDAIRYDDPFWNGIVDGNYRLMKYSMDLDKGLVNVTVDRSQYGSPFILDITSLDGTEVLI